MRARRAHILRGNSAPPILLDSIVVGLVTNNHPMESHRNKTASGTLEYASKAKHLFDNRVRLGNVYLVGDVRLVYAGSVWFGRGSFFLNTNRLQAIMYIVYLSGYPVDTENLCVLANFVQ
jgi:hypothetical protein